MDIYVLFWWYSDADALYSYGGGSDPIHYAGFQCSGTETHLVNCAIATNASLVQEINCVHDEDAGVRCTNGEQFHSLVLHLALYWADFCEEDTVRSNGGVVQVCHSMEWGLVCSNTISWYPNAAHVTCNEIGVPSSSELIFRSNAYSAPFPLIHRSTCSAQLSDFL